MTLLPPRGHGGGDIGGLGPGREEGGVILGPERHHVEALGLVVVQGVSVAGEDIAAPLKHHGLRLLDMRAIHSKRPSLSVPECWLG